MSLITVIGRGHSATRAMSHTLSASGVYMGEPLNISGDLLPPQSMYDACRVMAPFVRWQGGLDWNWDRLLEMEIPAEFKRLLEEYLVTIRRSKQENKGWKIPETTLIYPWIQRLFPKIRYIFWIRNPRDSIIGSHVTDNLLDFGIRYPQTEDVRLRRAISWKYQYDLVKAMPKPEHWIEVRMEDFVLDQENTLRRLEDFLEIPLARIPVNREAVGRWKSDAETNYFDFFEPAMREYGYELP